MSKEDIRELAEDNAIYEFNKFKKIYGEFTDEYVRHFYNKLAELRGGIDDVHTCNCQHDSNSRDNEPCCRCDSRKENANMVKVNSLEIIVRMIGNKPYYEIKYKKVGEDYYHVGYSSFNIDNVLKWRNECFELVDLKVTNADMIRNMSDEEMAERIASSSNFNCADYCDSFTQGCTFSCNKKGREIALKWLQSEAE